MAVANTVVLACSFDLDAHAVQHGRFFMRIDIDAC